MSVSLRETTGPEVPVGTSGGNASIEVPASPARRDETGVSEAFPGARESRACRETSELSIKKTSESTG